jgi:hypothetical protein
MDRNLDGAHYHQKATADAEISRSVRYNWLRFSLRNVPGSFGPKADSLEQ